MYNIYDAEHNDIDIVIYDYQDNLISYFFFSSVSNQIGIILKIVLFYDNAIYQ